MSSSTFTRILPLRNPTLWKGVALGVGMLVLLLVVAIPNLLRSRMAANSGSYRHFSARMSGGSGGAASENYAPDTVQADGPKVIYKAELDLVVASCAESQKKIEALAASESGFVESSTLEENSATIRLRVPSARFEAVRGKLRDLAISIRQDSVTAADVSKQYVDRESRLRNLRAEEQQFLEIGCQRPVTVSGQLCRLPDLAGDQRAAAGVVGGDNLFPGRCLLVCTAKSRTDHACHVWEEGD